jgi:peptidoglycan/LPS O-acetylase OafA/YrhL
MKNEELTPTAPSVGDETRRHLAFLDGWRGLAILLVLVGHFWLDAIVPGVSVLGVTLFFVLSGRLMAEILFEQNVPLPSFFARRLSRVYPGLLFFVLAVTLIFAGTGYRHGIVAVVSALTFTLNYAMIYGHPAALIDHLWSLCVEEHGYVLLALLALLMRARKWDASSSILALGLLALANGLVESVAPRRCLGRRSAWGTRPCSLTSPRASASPVPAATRGSLTPDWTAYRP